jgi:hypothetical protein
MPVICQAVYTAAIGFCRFPVKVKLVTVGEE